MDTFIKLTTKNKQTRRRQTVRNHLDYRAPVGQLAAGVDSNQHEAHVGNRGVGDQTFDIGLGEGHPRTVEDADNTQPHSNWRELCRRVREQRQGETQQTVSGSFQQDPREVNGTGGRSRECASGSQPCSGTTGILTAKAMKKPSINRYSTPLDIGVFSSSS